MHQRRILLVCGDSTLAGALQARLTSMGHETVAVASSEVDAMAMSAEFMPDVLLMDGALGTGSEASQLSASSLRSGTIPVVVLLPGVSYGSPDAPNRAGASSRTPLDDQQLRSGIEMALRASVAGGGDSGFEDRFFEISIDMLCILGFDGYFTKLNPAWERTLGFTREELMSRNFLEFVHPDDRQRTLEQNTRSRQGEQTLAFENRYLCSDGSFRWFHWNAAPDSAQRRIYSMARDITAAKQAGEERDRLVSELQSALAEVRDLREILPICSYCRKIRDDENYWQTVESYISRHTKTRFSHSICPSCMETEVDSMSRKPAGE